MPTVDPVCINTNINDTSNTTTKENIEKKIDYNEKKRYVFFLGGGVLIKKYLS